MKLVVNEILVPNTVKLALNMIVKNESKIIERLLISVLPIIDTYCICDTGSTDNTKEIIKDFFEKWDISGTIVEEEFIDFGYNRNYALQKCRETTDCDYILFLDADMQLKIGKDFDKNFLNEIDYCHILQGNDNFTYQNVRIIKNKPGFEYKGSTHEYIHIPGQLKCHVFDKNVLFINDLGDGGCKSNKFTRDIKLLLNEIQNKPNDPRAHFYLANSYFDSRQFTKAIDVYKKRIEIGGWAEEIFYSYYRIGQCFEYIQNIPKALSYYLEAYQSHPGRAEPLYRLIKLYRTKNKPEIANLFYSQAITIPHPPANALFVESDVYNYLLKYELFVFYFYLNDNDKLSYNPNITHYLFIELMNKEKRTGNILSNYRFYIKSLNDFNSKDNYQSVKLQDIAGRFVDNKLIDGNVFTASTPSISCLNNKTVFNIRYVNYYISGPNEYKYRENVEKTKNVCVEFHDDTFINLKTSKEMQNPEISEGDKKIIGEDAKVLEGIQDVRIIEFKNKLYYNGSIVYENKNGREVSMHFGLYDVSNSKMTGCVVESPNERKCEKNWAMFHNHSEILFVYEWNPLTIGKIENNKFITKLKRNTSRYFSYIRGSTNGIIINNEIWFVCHMVAHQNQRYYYHSFVVLDIDTLFIKKYSIPFTFHGKPIEYCCGLRRHNDLLYLTYSINDASSNIAVLKLDSVQFIDEKEFA